MNRKLLFAFFILNGIFGVILLIIILLPFKNIESIAQEKQQKKALSFWLFLNANNQCRIINSYIVYPNLSTISLGKVGTFLLSIKKLLSWLISLKI